MLTSSQNRSSVSAVPNSRAASQSSSSSHAAPHRRTPGPSSSSNPQGLYAKRGTAKPHQIGNQIQRPRRTIERSPHAPPAALSGSKPTLSSSDCTHTTAASTCPGENSSSRSPAPNGASARPALQRAPPGERVHAAQAHAIRSKLLDYLRHLSRTSRRHRGSKRTRTADSPIAIIHPQAAEPIRFQEPWA
jgi:hypothetical protein